MSSRKRDKLQHVADNCKEETKALTKVSIVPYDAASIDSVDTTVDSALAFAADHGIDILMLNAGTYQTKTAIKTPQEERELITRVNYRAPVDLAHSLIERGRWKERGYGQIVVTSSVMAHGPQSLASSYAASKAAVRSYFQTLSTEEYSWLRVDVACVGGTNTAMWGHYEDGRTKATQNGLMSPERVARLMLRAMTGPFWMFHESWITKSEGLLFMWMSHYTPVIFQISVHVMAYVRLAVFEHEKLDVVDMSSLLHRLTLVLIGRYP